MKRPYLRKMEKLGLDKTTKDFVWTVARTAAKDQKVDFSLYEIKISDNDMLNIYMKIPEIYLWTQDIWRRAYYNLRYTPGLYWMSGTTFMEYRPYANITAPPDHLVYSTRIEAIYVPNFFKAFKRFKETLEILKAEGCFKAPEDTRDRDQGTEVQTG